MAWLWLSRSSVFSRACSQLRAMFCTHKKKYASQTIKKGVFPYEKPTFSSSIRSAAEE
jgi:hypothetical protein